MRKLGLLDNLGALGALLSAAACPACFPVLAAAGAAFGLGAFVPFEGYAMYVLQGFVLLALAGNILSFRAHKQIGPLLLGILSAALIFFAFYGRFNPALVYAGLFGLLVVAIWNAIAQKRCARYAPSGLIRKSVITCPHCGFQKEETMPADACQHFYECTRCKALLKPKADDCCVFCSYGSAKCPPQQKEAACPTC